MPASTIAVHNFQYYCLPSLCCERNGHTLPEPGPPTIYNGQVFSLVFHAWNISPVKMLSNNCSEISGPISYCWLIMLAQF